MKTKILSLVVVLSVLLSLGIVAPVSATSTTGPQLNTVTSSITCEDDVCCDCEPEIAPTYDICYVSLDGDDENDGSIGAPKRTITAAVRTLPYDEANVGDDAEDLVNPDPNGSLSYIPDMIRVDATINPPGYIQNYYGFDDINDYDTISENIVIMEPVYIQAWNNPNNNPVGNRDNTVVDISRQSLGPYAVITILSSDVIIEGLSVMGGSVGISIHPPEGEEFIEDVTIQDCYIKSDPESDGTGIEAWDTKYLCIRDNTIHVGTGGAELFTLSAGPNAWGIDLEDCFQACILNNNIDVKATVIGGDPSAVAAYGISMGNCDRSCVKDNDVAVQASGDNTAYGIKIWLSDLVRVIHNTVTVVTSGATCAFTFGIKVGGSDRALIQYNDVTAIDSDVGNVWGLMLCIGIWLKNSSESDIDQNSVLATGDSVFNSNAAIVPFVCPNLDVTEEVAELEEALTQLDGDATFVYGGSAVIGIKVSGGHMNKVTGNNKAAQIEGADPLGVKVTLAADFLSRQKLPGGGGDAEAFGVAVAAGILGFCSDWLLVAGNDVMVSEPEFFNWRSSGLETVGVFKVESEEELLILSGPDAKVAGMTICIGIGLHNCNSSSICENDVVANSSMYIEALQKTWVGEEAADASMLDLLDSQMVASIFQSIYDSTESEAIDAQGRGRPYAFAKNKGLCAGVAIVVTCSEAPYITNNIQAVGTADLMGNTEANMYEEVEDEGTAKAIEGGVSIGGGILVVFSPGATIDDNHNVVGDAMVDLKVKATHDDLTMTAKASGGGAAIGFGIIDIGPCPLGDGDIQLPVDTPELALGTCYPPIGLPPCGDEIVGNEVSASGYADNVTVCAIEEVPDQYAKAEGCAIGVAIGIGTLWTPCILIMNNCVNADAYADVCTNAVSPDTFDPQSTGGAAAAGVGIVTVFSCNAQIVENIAFGQAIAEGFVLSLEYPVESDSANAFGGSIALGAGILVFGSPESLVTGNSGTCEEDNCLPGAVGLADAQTMVWAINAVPLDTARAKGLAASLGVGIAVICSPCTDVVECNSAAGEGTARACDFACADFDYACSLAVAASIDILVVMPPDTLRFSEADYDTEAEHYWYKCGVVNYNSLVDPLQGPLGSNSCALVIDVGLLKIGWPKLDAQFNYWNAVNGPSGFGPGDGEAVIWCGKSVDFSPWLYVEHCQVLEDQRGYFGFCIDLCKGVNAVSTPIALSDGLGYDDIVLEGTESNTWGDVLRNSGLVDSYKYLQKWDSVAKDWVTIGDPDSEPFDPLVGYYIYLFDWAPRCLVLLVNGHGDSMPMVTLTEGWNLIGPNPLFTVECSPVDDVLVSAEQTASGLPGYTQVISPQVRCQPAWIYTPNMKCAYDMISGHAYWVYVLNDVSLVGFGFTPLPDQLYKIYDGYYK